MPCPHCKRRLEWLVRVDPLTGYRTQLPPCDAEPIWARADPNAPEIGFEPRGLLAFRGVELSVEEIAAGYWRRERMEIGGQPVSRVWRLHRCREGQAARAEAAEQRQEKRVETSRQTDMW